MSQTAFWISYFGCLAALVVALVIVIKRGEHKMSDKFGQVEATASRFGFTARAVPKGFFLAPVTRNRFGHRHVGDDVMLIYHNGEIVPYANDAQAFLAATAIAAIAKAEGRS
jgi:hypothetical protein